METRKRFSLLKLLIIIVCISLIIVSLGINILFRGNNVPNIFGRVIYIVEQDNPMSGDLTTGAALISKEAKDISVGVGDIVLCYPADDPAKLCLRGVNYVVEAEDGTEKYYTKDSYHEDMDSITKDKIVAICTGYPESKELGAFITFALDIKGILLMLVLTSVILIVMIIVAIIRARSDRDDDDDYDFYEYDEDEDENEKKKSKKQAHTKSADPLYEPSPAVAPNPELERKKMSIAENFKPKQVNPDSPYQKEKEKERTMQFKTAQKGSLSNTMSFSATSTAESSFAARNQNAQSSTAPTADALREEMLRKTAEAERTERTGTYNIKTPEPITDNTGVLSKSQVAELSNGSAEPKEERRPAAKVEPRKSSSPDISDILKATGSGRSKKPSDMSVDDLLKMISDEKKKL